MKIEFQTISFKNFLTFGNKEHYIELKPGLNLITGIDHQSGRSNGSGKSSWLEAVTFALFGRTNRSINKDKIVNWKNRKNCEVSVEFIIGLNHYKVHRGIKPDFLEIYKDKIIIPQPPDVRQYQKMLETDILHIDFHTFISLVHINLNNYVPFLQMDTPKKRIFIEKMFGLELFSDLNKLTTEKLVLTDNQLTLLNNELTFKSKMRSDLIQRSNMLHNQKRELKSSKSNLDKVVEKLSKIKDPKDLIATVSISSSVFELQKSELEQSIAKLDTSLWFLNDQKNAIIDIISKKDLNIKQHKESKISYSKIVSENKNIDTLVEIEQKKQEENDSIIKKLTEELANCNVMLASAKTNYSHYVSNLNKLSNETECPTCGTKVDKNILLPNIQNNIDNWKKSIDTHKKESKKLSMAIVDAEVLKSSNNLTELLEKQKLYHEAVTKLQGINALIKSFSIVDDTLKFEEIKSNIEDKEKEHKILTKNIEKLKKEIDKINKILESLHKKSEIYNSLITEKTILEEKLTWEDKTKKDILIQIDDINKKIKEIDDGCKKLDDTIIKLSSLKDYILYIKTLCKDENVKQYAISSIMPFLTKRINEYLSQAGMSYFVNFNNLLEDDIKGPGIYGASYGNLSGGESKSIDLAILFALLDVSRLHFGVYPDILMLDELLDSSVDSRGIDSIMKVVWLRQFNDNSKVFLVTHRNDWTELTNMRKYIVEKDKGFSTIREVED